MRRKRYPNEFPHLCLKTFFSKLYITKKIYQTVEKKQLLIVLPFLGCSSLETRNRLNSCIINQLPFCSLIIAFKSKTRLSSLFKLRASILKYFCSHLIYKLSCSCCNAAHYGESNRDLFVRVSEHLGIISLTQKRAKNPKKSAFMELIL